MTCVLLFALKEGRRVRRTQEEGIFRVSMLVHRLRTGVKVSHPNRTCSSRGEITEGGGVSTAGLKSEFRTPSCHAASIRLAWGPPSRAAALTSGGLETQDRPRYIPSERAGHPGRRSPADRSGLGVLIRDALRDHTSFLSYRSELDRDPGLQQTRRHTEKNSF